MANTKILLREDVENLGGRGDIVKVKAGYARNYLLPHKLAVQATAANVKQIEQQRAALLKRAEGERAEAQDRADVMGKLTLNFERRVGEHGILYGSVTSMDIAEALKDKGHEVDRRRIILREPIKEIGDFQISVRLHRDVTVDVPVKVAPEGGGTANTNDAAAPNADAATTQNETTPDANAEMNPETNTETATS